MIRIFKAKDLRDLFKDESMYYWGSQDGTGDSLFSTFSDYYDRFLYDADFATADSVYYNQVQQRGNTINNVIKEYPGCIVVEYYLPGIDPKFAGMDWRALRMVFEPYEGEWYVVGLIHAAWTS